jgi:phosphoserine phosphatase
MKKLLVCDVEGTIFKANYKIDGVDYASTIWQPLARSLGPVGIDREKELAGKWESGGYKTYMEWVEETYSYIHKDLGLKHEVFDELIREAEYMPGVKEFFDDLDRNKYIIVMISGGTQELVRRAQNELRIDHGHGACEYFFDPVDGSLVSRSMVPCDFEGKYEYVKYLFEQYGLNATTDWIFIGDGKNDCDIAKRAPVSISINGHDLLKAVVTHSKDVDGSEITNFFQVAEIIRSLPDKLSPRDNNKKHKAPKLKNPIGQIDLEKRIEELELENRRLKQENNDLKGRRRRPIKIPVPERYQTQHPIMNLSEILDEHKVVFVGLKEEYINFRYLDKFHKNLVVIPASEENKDFRSLRDVEFLFVFKGCIGHSLSKKAIRELKIPYSLLPIQRNEDMIVNAMTNVLFEVLEKKRSGDQ